MNDSSTPPQGKNGFLKSLIVVGILAIGFALMFKIAMKLKPSPQLSKEFPAIEAVGWFNGPAPSAETLRGQVLVVDAWADWCGPCRAAIPSLLKLHSKFKDRGVTFVGLTSEGEDPQSVENCREFVESLKIPWVNGYGASKTLSKLEVHEIPQLWVVDQQNRIIFHEVGFGYGSVHHLEQTIEKALAKK